MVSKHLEKIAINSDGDARKGLNILERILEALKNKSSDKQELSDELFMNMFHTSVRRFDKKGDYFYDFISALHKSVRGSARDVLETIGNERVHGMARPLTTCVSCASRPPTCALSAARLARPIAAAPTQRTPSRVARARVARPMARTRTS